MAENAMTLKYCDSNTYKVHRVSFKHQLTYQKCNTQATCHIRETCKFWHRWEWPTRKWHTNRHNHKLNILKLLDKSIAPVLQSNCMNQHTKMKKTVALFCCLLVLAESGLRINWRKHMHASYCKHTKCNERLCSATNTQSNPSGSE